MDGISRLQRMVELEIFDEQTHPRWNAPLERGQLLSLRAQLRWAAGNRARTEKRRLATPSRVQNDESKS